MNPDKITKAAAREAIRILEDILREADTPNTTTHHLGMVVSDGLDRMRKVVRSAS
jgi:hypothetical protein